MFVVFVVVVVFSMHHAPRWWYL